MRTPPAARAPAAFVAVRSARAAEGPRRVREELARPRRPLVPGRRGALRHAGGHRPGRRLVAEIRGRGGTADHGRVLDPGRAEDSAPLQRSPATYRQRAAPSARDRTARRTAGRTAVLRLEVEPRRVRSARRRKGLPGLPVPAGRPGGVRDVRPHGGRREISTRCVSCPPDSTPTVTAAGSSAFSALTGRVLQADQRVERAELDHAGQQRHDPRPTPTASSARRRPGSAAPARTESARTRSTVPTFGLNIAAILLSGKDAAGPPAHA
ncbi:MAG: hypothetical protein MZU95_01185 [Desulfomicrobium escambiense]|nr:hypothetical protein [Desulfomicrobium escambiense]